MTGLERADPHHHSLQPNKRRLQTLPAKLQLAPIMRLQAHQAVGEGVEAFVDQ